MLSNPPSVIRRALMLLALLAFLGACAAPPLPALAELPGEDFSTPEHAFSYLREAVRRGDGNDSFEWHEYLCLALSVRQSNHLTAADYHFFRSSLLRVLREKLGDLQTVQILGTDVVAIPGTTRVDPDTIILILGARDLRARATLVRETTVEVSFRGVDEPVYATLADPSRNLSLSDAKLTLRLAVDQALAEKPELTADDVAHVRYRREWKFKNFTGDEGTTQLERDLKAEYDRANRERAATAKPPRS